MAATPPDVRVALDLDATLPGAESRVDRWRCGRGAVELWTIRGGGHVPRARGELTPRLWQFLGEQHR